MDSDINAYLRLSPMDMIIVCVSTLIIIVITERFLWDKVPAYLDACKAATQADIGADMRNKEVRGQYKRQYEEQMADAHSEVHEILESTKANAAQERREILAVVRGEAEAVKEEVRENIEREKIQAHAGMRGATVDMAFEAAKWIVSEELDESTHKQCMNDLIEHAGDELWQT